MAKKISIWSNKKLLLFVPLSLAIIGSLAVIIFKFGFAAGSINYYFNPASSTQKIPGETISIGAYASVTGDTANAVELNITYNSNVLEIPTTNGWTNSSQCSVQFNAVNNPGNLVLSLGCSPAITSSNVLMTTINFKAKAAGSSSITYSTLTKAINATNIPDHEIPENFSNANVTVIDPVSSVSVTSNKTRVMQISSNYVIITAKSLNSSGVGLSGKQISVTGLRTGDSITPSTSTTNSNGEISYTYKSSNLGDTVLTFSSEGKSATLSIKTVKTGDINGDNFINISDAAALMVYWNTSVVDNNYSDVNCDGSVNITDAAALMSNWNG